MAKKKTGKSAAQTSEIFSRLRGNMKRLQREAEILIHRTRKQAAQLISRDQKRALDRILNQAKRLGSGLEKRATQASKDVESQSARLLATIEREAAKRLNPLLRRLDLPSRKEVQNLSRRLAQLEKRLQGKRPASAETAPAPKVVEPPVTAND